MKNILLCSIVLMAALAGCKTKDTQVLDWEPNTEIREHITDVVQDVERRTAMLAIMDSFDTEMKTITQFVQSQRETIMKANADYEVSRADLEKMYGALYENVGQLSNAAKRHSFDLRKHCSAEEWNQIFAHTKHDKIKYF